MNRPTTTLSLEKSGATVTLYSYLVTGELRAIRKEVFSKMNLDANKENQDIKINGATMSDVEEKALSLLVVSIEDSGGKVGNISDYIYNLPISDGDALYKKVNEIYHDSELSDEAKKK